MNIKIRSRNIEITPAINDYVTKKIKTLDKFLDSSKEILCEIELGKTTNHHKSGDIFRAEVNISEPGSRQFYAATEESDLYAAIDVVRDEAEREIVSQKSRYKTLLRKGATQVKMLIKKIDIRPKKWWK